jgi:RNA polymerase sigma-70 factor (ECF subfamily)
MPGGLASIRASLPEHRLDDSIEDLVEQAQRGRSACFAELIRRYERTALAIAYATVGAGDLSADVVQEAFVRAWRKLGSLKQPSRFGSWLCGIVRNLAVDERRRVRRQATENIDTLSPACHNDPAAGLGRREQSAQIQRALEKLDEISRSAVVLRYYEGLSSRQIADLLDLSPAAVDMRLSRARQELKMLLGEPEPAAATVAATVAAAGAVI